MSIQGSRPLGLGLVAVTLVSALFLVIGFRRDAADVSKPRASLQTVELAASWAESYHSLKAIKAHSDVVAEGTIAKTLNTYQRDNGIVFTDFEFDIASVVASPKNTSVSARIVVHQTGGIAAGKLYEVSDDPLFQPGEHLILFLREYSPGHYNVVAGPQGRFTVERGQVIPLPEHIKKVAASTPEGEFIKLAKES